MYVGVMDSGGLNDARLYEAHDRNEAVPASDRIFGSLILAVIDQTGLVWE